MKIPRCLILSEDKEQLNLLKLTLREYDIRFRLVPNLEMLGPLSTGAMTLAWFIDLDSIQKSVTQVSALARRVAPDSKLIFLSSQFTLELARECLRERAASLLVKPLLIQRLVQSISTFQQESELLDREEFIPESEEIEAEEARIIPPKYTEDSLLRPSRFSCPVCLHQFEAERFKHWMFPVSEMDTDFCPACPSGVFPELYLIGVCPQCLYANIVGRFDRRIPKEKEKRVFLEKISLTNRQKIAGQLDFSGKRDFYQGIRSFELARVACTDLQLGDWETLYGEFLLKASWLCRRMGKKLQEQEVQIMALQHYMTLYRPFLRSDGMFPKKAEIAARLPLGKTPLRERAIIVTGFLAADLSRRLSILEQAEFYFSEVLKLPFLGNYPLLLQHIQTAKKLLGSRENPDQ